MFGSSSLFTSWRSYTIPLSSSSFRNAFTKTGLEKFCRKSRVNRPLTADISTLPDLAVLTVVSVLVKPYRQDGRMRNLVD